MKIISTQTNQSHHMPILIVLNEISDALLNGKDILSYTYKDELLHTISCKNAIKAGWSTSEYEQKNLVEKLISMPDIKYCPHGRPTIITMSDHDLRKEFERG